MLSLLKDHLRLNYQSLLPGQVQILVLLAHVVVEELIIYFD